MIDFKAKLEEQKRILAEAQDEYPKSNFGHLHEDAIRVLKGKGFQNGEIVDWFESRGIKVKLDLSIYPVLTKKPKEKNNITRSFQIDGRKYYTIWSVIRGVEIRNALPPSKKGFRIYLPLSTSEIMDTEEFCLYNDEFDLTSPGLEFRTECPLEYW